MLDGSASAPVAPTSVEGSPTPFQAAAPPPAPKGPSYPESVDVKVNGKIVKMSWQEVLDNASMSHAAVSKFEDAKKQKAEVEKLLSKAKTDPIQALLDPSLGLTKDQLREAIEKYYMSEYIEPESMNEDQKARREAERQLKKYQEQEAETKARAEQDEEAKLTNAQKETLQTQIIEALDSSGLPKTKFFAARVAFYMRNSMLQGFEAPVSHIVRQVKQEFNTMISGVSKDATAEQLVTMLGDDTINKIRKYDLENLRKKRQGAPPSAPPPGEPPKKIYDVNQRLNYFRLNGHWPS